MTGDRFGTAVLSLLITLVTTGFFILAGLLTVLGYAVARLIVPATPAAGVLFLLDSFRDFAFSWAERIVQFLVLGPLVFLAALVLFAFTKAIFTAGMPRRAQVPAHRRPVLAGVAAAAPAYRLGQDAPAC